MKLIKAVGQKISKLTQMFSWDIGIDLGSNNTLIYLKERGVIIDEPTMLARQKKKRWTGLSAPKSDTKRPIAFGYKAKSMWNREPKQIEVVSPIKNGIITDLEGLEGLMSYYFKLIYEVPSKYPKIFKPRVIVGVPSFINQVQKRAIKSVLMAAGAREVVLIEEVVLASIGLNLPADVSGGLVIVDVGGGKTEASVVSMGGVVVGRGIKTAGEELDNAIVNYIKMKYGMLVGPNSAEKIKIDVETNNLVRGRDLETGLPRSVKLTKSEINEAVSLELTKIVKLVKAVLDETPPELMEDVLKRGIVLVGNGAKLKNLAEMIESETKIYTVVAEDPGMAIIRGAGLLVEERKLLDQVRRVALG
ncbi:MAG TPA: rod shape-determining protein [Candidatus Woesebacteria bacterium]|nr:rod shape-determining protein [Candidatus Woesebacteria bacterium]HOG37789.1 rod shape-determining protein [Candidatus Woesebacteria bacterium]